MKVTKNHIRRLFKVNGCSGFPCKVSICVVTKYVLLIQKYISFETVSAPIILPSDCKCGIRAHCNMGYLVEFVKASSPMDCLHQCHRNVENNCNWVTFQVHTNSCFLFNKCEHGKSYKQNNFKDQNIPQFFQDSTYLFRTAFLHINLAACNLYLMWR